MLFCMAVVVFTAPIFFCRCFRHFPIMIFVTTHTRRLRYWSHLYYCSTLLCMCHICVHDIEASGKIWKVINKSHNPIFISTYCLHTATCLNVKRHVSLFFCYMMSNILIVSSVLSCRTSPNFSNSRKERAPCWLQGVLCPWFICWFWHYTYRLLVYIICFPISPFFFTFSLLIYSLTYHFLWE